MKLSDEPVPFFPLPNAVNDLNSVLTKGEMGRDYYVKKCERKQGKQFGIHNGLLSALASPSDHLEKLVSAESSSTALSVSPALREGTQQFCHWALGYSAPLLALAPAPDLHPGAQLRGCLSMDTSVGMTCFEAGHKLISPALGTCCFGGFLWVSTAKQSEHFCWSWEPVWVKSSFELYSW